MKNKICTCCMLLLSVALFSTKAIAQKMVYKDPVLKIDFGSLGKSSSINLESLKRYDEQDSPCPDDGHYSFTSHTSNCFNGDWITMKEDHTPGDNQGNMMLVNAAERPGTFFKYAVNNLKSSTMYEISVWIVNVCKTTSPCNPTPPYISFTILTNTGMALKKINTGTISPTDRPTWLRYYNEFKIPAGITGIVIQMDDETIGGCGNDFAIDDITLREIEIIQPEPVKIETPMPIVKVPVKTAIPESKPIVQKEKPVVKQVPAPELKKANTVIIKEEVKAAPTAVKPVIKERKEAIPVPDVLVSRSNPVVKEIATEEAELLIELYDNGEIDGDTVSVYHNNVLVVSNKGLSEKPISIKLKVDKLQPHHELVMVANNLGSIPPNTSLMIITANDKRYEIFISSSKQKNAKVLIDLKE